MAMENGDSSPISCTQVVDHRPLAGNRSVCRSARSPTVRSQFVGSFFFLLVVSAFSVL